MQPVVPSLTGARQCYGAISHQQVCRACEIDSFPPVRVRIWPNFWSELHSARLRRQNRPFPLGSEINRVFYRMRIDLGPTSTTRTRTWTVGFGIKFQTGVEWMCHHRPAFRVSSYVRSGVNVHLLSLQVGPTLFVRRYALARARDPDLSRARAARLICFTNSRPKPYFCCGSPHTRKHMLSANRT